MQSSQIILEKGTLPYSSCYCQENVYMAVKQLEQSKPENAKIFAVFLTNPLKSTAIRWQKSSKDAANDYVVNWDYHVILLVKNKNKTNVYDHDSRLPWPTNFQEYYEKALKTKQNEPRTYFRVVPANMLLEHFASDRSHMLKTVNGRQRYAMPPPTYAAISNKKGETMTLPKYLDCDVKEARLGVVLSPDDFYKYFTT